MTAEQATELKRLITITIMAFTKGVMANHSRSGLIIDRETGITMTATEANDAASQAHIALHAYIDALVIPAVAP